MKLKNKYLPTSKLKSVLMIINYKTFIVTILAAVSTWLCGKYQIIAEFPLTLVGIAIVFPVVFSIDSAYKRREKILGFLGDFKAHLNALYLAGRDWISDEEFSREFKEQVNQIFLDLREFVSASTAKELEQKENELYDSISRLSRKAQKFRELDLYLGEVSRINQYISKLAIDVENIKAIRLYPTPVTLRAYSKVFMFSFPILYGPYFAFVAQEFSSGLEYMMPLIFSFILVSLDNIQGHLENPFDQVGEDDVQFDVESFGEKLR